MPDRRSRWFCTLAALIAALLLTAMPASRAKAEDALVANSHCGRTIQVQPATASGNPYAGSYCEWDVWLLDHVLSHVDGKPPAGELARISVSAEGYVVPLVDYYEMVYAADGPERLENCPYYLDCSAALPADLSSGLAAELARVRAASLPRIPDWLASKPPVRALFLEGGEIVTLGVPGDGTGRQPRLFPLVEEQPQPGQRFRRYNATGDYLGRTGPDEEWWRLYFDKLDEVLAAFNSTTVTWMELNGYIVFTDPQNVSLFEVYDYTGVKISDTNKVFQQRELFQWVDGGLLPLVRSAQPGN